jgi:hypothetical protein
LVSQDKAGQLNLGFQNLAGQYWNNYDRWGHFFGRSTHEAWLVVTSQLGRLTRPMSESTHRVDLQVDLWVMTRHLVATSRTTHPCI